MQSTGVGRRRAAKRESLLKRGENLRLKREVARRKEKREGSRDVRGVSEVKEYYVHITG